METAGDDAASSTIGREPGIELIYAGFWPRLASHLIDIAILTPYALYTSWFSYASKEGFVVGQALSYGIALVFEIYLVKRFGGSPGKLIMKMRIAKVDGSPVGYKEAWIRYSVLLAISLASTAALVSSALSTPDSEYAALTHTTRVRYLREVAPAWYKPVEIAGSVWVWSEFVVLLTNKKRRAIHDFMAGTVVVRTGR